MLNIEQPPQTPLQFKLEAIATDIGKIGLLAAVFTVLVLFIRFFYDGYQSGMDWRNDWLEYVQTMFQHIIIGVTIIVVAIPEGLPLAVMIALAYSVRKMLLDKNFVK